MISNIAHNISKQSAKRFTHLRFMQELITIGIPTYNGAKYLRESLDSVINQTYQYLDILVIDDCSTDETITIIEEYQKSDNRIRLIRNQSNPGMVANWNRCLREARAEWIKLHFQDDLMNPDTIERMYNAAINLKVRLVLTDREYFFEEGVEDFTEKLKRLSDDFKSESVIPSKYFFEKALETRFSQNFIGEPILGLIHKSLPSEIGYYDVRLHQIVDFEFWLRAGLYEQVGFISERLHLFRVHSDSQGAKNNRAKIMNVTTKDMVQIAINMLTEERYRLLQKHDHEDKLRIILHDIIKTELISNGIKTIRRSIGYIPEELIQLKRKERFWALMSDLRNSFNRVFYAFKG